MFRPRVIPALLLKDRGLVKTVAFRSPTYIGDPLNAVKIFNELEADELCFLDITASKDGRPVSLELVRKIGDEAFMPFAVGGGISSVEQIRDILGAGAEKVVLNTSAAQDPELVRRASALFGAQSIVVSIDVKKCFFGGRKVYVRDGSRRTALDPAAYAVRMAELGAGEILLNSIDRDGSMRGYDLELIRQVSGAVEVPVIALGGAGGFSDFRAAAEAGACACAAGSLFVFHGPRRAVLINYPDKAALSRIFRADV